MTRIKGFSLIKLLVVVAMIGIIAAIAVPAYLGKFEKAEVADDKGNAKANVSELLAVQDSIVAGGPFSLLPYEGQEECIGSLDAEFTGDTCQSMYSQYADSACTSHPNGTSDIICAGFFQNDAVVVSER